jgi:hypothetical protein
VFDSTNWSDSGESQVAQKRQLAAVQIDFVVGATKREFDCQIGDFVMVEIVFEPYQEFFHGVESPLRWYRCAIIALNRAIASSQSNISLGNVLAFRVSPPLLAVSVNSLRRSP